MASPAHPSSSPGAGLLSGDLTDSGSGPRLRDYQADLCERLDEAGDSGARSMIIQLGTGGGKTHTAAAWLRTRLDRDPDLVIGWLVHTRGLRRQAHEALRDWGVDFVDWSAVAADRRQWQPGRVHAFGATMRLPRMLPKARTVLVLDECHRSAARTVAHHVEHARWQQVAGLSATPARRGWPDEVTVSHARFVRQWDRVLCGPPLTELVRVGALADVVLRSPRAAGGDRSVLRDDRMRDSGYSSESEAQFERTLSLDAAVRYIEPLPPKQTIWFCSSVRGARRLNRMLVRSAVVTSETSERHRERCYREFNDGTLANLVSVAVLVEGVDLPAAGRVVLLRPSRSRILLSQAVGRGMRPPGQLEVFDFAGSYQELGAHPLDDLPWEEVLTGEPPQASKTAGSMPRICPTPACETLIGPRSGRLCPTCYAEIGRWCVACERPLLRIEDGAHRRCRSCAESERNMHSQWAHLNGVTPVVDRDQLDDSQRADRPRGPTGTDALNGQITELASTAESIQREATSMLRLARAAEARSHALTAVDPVPAVDDGEAR